MEGSRDEGPRNSSVVPRISLTCCCNCKRVSAVRITWLSSMHAARCTYNTGPRSMAACARSAPSKQSCPVRGATTAAGMSCAHLHAWQGVVRGTTQSSCHRVPGAVLEYYISKIMVHHTNHDPADEEWTISHLALLGPIGIA